MNSSTNYYIYRNDVYNNTIYMSPLPKRERYKKYKCLNEGHTLEDKDTYIVRKILLKNPDDVQWFCLKNNYNMHVAVTERVCQSNVVKGIYNPNYELNKKIMRGLYRIIRNDLIPEDQIFNTKAMEEYIRSRPGYTSKQKDQICSTKVDFDLYNWLDILRENWEELYFTEDKNGETILKMKNLQNPIAKLSRFRAFIKDESYPESKRPRNITGASDFDKFIFGVFGGAMGHAFFKQKFAIKLIPFSFW